MCSSDLYHANEDDKVKSVDQLMNIYYGSVGRNANLLLNLGVDRRGLVNENDERRLMEFKAAREAAFRTNLAKGRITASQVRGRDARFAAGKAIDGDPATYWATDDGATTGSLELDLDRDAEFDAILVQEPIALGQRVRQFSIEVWRENRWETVARQTTIGYKRIVRFPAVTASRVRLKIDSARACPAISNLELYKTK